MRKITSINILLAGLLALTALFGSCDTNDECEGNSLCIHGYFQSTTHCTCFCNNQWEGEACDFCPLEAGDCPNGTVDYAICDCECDPQFCGENCDIPVLPCENGGTWDDFTCSCDCTEGWIGAVCDSIG